MTSQASSSATTHNIYLTLLRRSKAFQWRQNRSEILQQIKNLGSGSFKRPLYHGGGINLRVRPRVNRPDSVKGRWFSWNEYISTSFIRSLLPKFSFSPVLFSSVDCQRIQLKTACGTIWKTQGAQVGGQWRKSKSLEILQESSLSQQKVISPFDFKNDWKINYQGHKFWFHWFKITWSVYFIEEIIRYLSIR